MFFVIFAAKITFAYCILPSVCYNRIVNKRYRKGDAHMDEREESGLTDDQFRFAIRELLAYAEQAPDKDAIVKHLEELLRDGEND